MKRMLGHFLPHDGLSKVDVGTVPNAHIDDLTNPAVAQMQIDQYFISDHGIRHHDTIVFHISDDGMPQGNVFLYSNKIIPEFYPVVTPEWFENHQKHPPVILYRACWAARPAIKVMTPAPASRVWATVFILSKVSNAQPIPTR